MKRFSLLLASLVLFYGLALAQNDKISFNETEHNFGKVSDKDGRVTFDFVFTNNGDEPVILSNVTASCGCTKPQWSKEPVGKGKTGVVTAIYDPSGQRGSFDKTITVYLINQPTPIKLKIKGEVVGGEAVKKRPEQEFPVAIGSNYLLKTEKISFGQVTGKEANNFKLEVFNNSDKPVTQKVQKLPKYLTVTFNPVIIPAKTAATIDVALNVQDEKLYGNLSGEIPLVINEVTHSLPYSATVLDNFSKWTAPKKANAGKVNVSASEINLGNFSSGNSRTLKISNSGKSVLNIHNIQSSDPAVTVSKSHFNINPGEIAEIKVNVDSKKIQSNLSSTLSIITNDPNKPVSEVAIIANKKS